MAGRRADAIVAITVLAIGIVIGAIYRTAYDRAGGQQDIPKREFGAAVAMACGHGFVNPGYFLTPALDEFLTSRRDRMSCSDLPEKFSPEPLNVTQGLYRYLMVAAALVWRVTGPSWSGLTPLFALAYGLTLAAAYGIFRLGIGRVLSTAATAALAVSPVHLQHLPFLRDYAKAPFILAVVVIMGRLAAGEWSTRRVLGYAAAFGVVLGIGVGFRNDLLIAVPAWIAVVFLATPGSLRAHLKTKAACLAVSAAAFVVAAWPVLRAYEAGSNTGHVALLGVMTSFDDPLGIAKSIYDPGYVYLDGFASALIQSFAFRQHGEIVTYLSRGYDRAAVEYLLTIARHWPADILARAYASVLTVLELPFAAGVHVSSVPVGASGRVLLKFYFEHARVLQLLNGLGLAMVAATLAVISVRRMRTAFVLLGLVVYFAGYPALQFHVRHYFHLEFIGWWALAFLVERAVAAVRERRQLSWPTLVPHVARAAVFVAAAVALVAGSLIVLRTYQTVHGRRLLREAYFGAEREALATSIGPARQAGWMLVEPQELWQGRSKEPVATAYVAAQVSGADCRASQLPLTVRYDAAVVASDFSHDVTVRVVPGGGATWVFVPVFDNPTWTRFRGIELPSADRRCLTGMFRVRKDRVPPVLLDIAAPPGWEHARLYQTLAAWESASDGEDGQPTLYSRTPRSLRPAEQPTPFALSTPHLQYRNAIVHDGARGTLRIAGHPDATQSLVVVLDDQMLPAGSTVIARGDVVSGGVALSVWRDGKVMDSIAVDARGPFEAAVAIPAAGRYSVSLSNHVTGRLAERLPHWLVRTDVTITSFGWLPAESDS